MRKRSTELPAALGRGRTGNPALVSGIKGHKTPTDPPRWAKSETADKMCGRTQKKKKTVTKKGGGGVAGSGRARSARTRMYNRVVIRYGRPLQKREREQRGGGRGENNARVEGTRRTFTNVPRSPCPRKALSTRSRLRSRSTSPPSPHAASAERRRSSCRCRRQRVLRSGCRRRHPRHRR